MKTSASGYNLLDIFIVIIGILFSSLCYATCACDAVDNWSIEESKVIYGDNPDNLFNTEANPSVYWGITYENVCSGGWPPALEYCNNIQCGPTTACTHGWRCDEGESLKIMSVGTGFHTQCVTAVLHKRVKKSCVCDTADIRNIEESKVIYGDSPGNMFNVVADSKIAWSTHYENVCPGGWPPALEYCNNVQCGPTTACTHGWKCARGESLEIKSLGSGLYTQCVTAVLHKNVLTISDITKTGMEDTILSFTSTDFVSHFSTSDGETPLTKIKIISLPTNGELKLSGNNVLQNQVINIESLNNLTFKPIANWNGSTSFSWQGHDGIEYFVEFASVNIIIYPENDLPTVYDVVKLGFKNTVISFAAIDFSEHFSDVDGDILDKIKIISSPDQGALRLFGADVYQGQVINYYDLNSLTFMPDTNWRGTTNFSWQGHDGTGYSAVAANVDITIKEIPIVTTTSVMLKYTENDGSVIIDNGITIKDSDTITNATVSITGGFSPLEDSLTFADKFGITGNYSSSAGVLNLTGVSSVSNYQAALRSVAYINNSEKPTTFNRIISFQVSNGVDNSNIATRVINVIGENDIPIVKQIIKSGRVDQILYFKKSDFVNKYFDSDDDSMVGIKIVSLPNLGVLKLNSVPINKDAYILSTYIDSLTFAPNSGWSGETDFAWKAFDGKDYSVVGSAIIKISITSTSTTTSADDEPSFWTTDVIVPMVIGVVSGVVVFVVTIPCAIITTLLAKKFELCCFSNNRIAPAPGQAGAP